MRGDEAFTRSVRYRVGVALIVAGHGLLAAALLAPLVGIGVGGVGGIALTGEALSTLSIVFLGKAGFLAIKSKVVRAIKAGYTAPVSAFRHYLGLGLFLLHVVTYYAIVVYAWEAFKHTTRETPFPVVFGMTFEQQAGFVLTMFVLGEVSFVVSLYVLGADWWERFRRIFVHEPRAVGEGA